MLRIVLRFAIYANRKEEKNLETSSNHSFNMRIFQERDLSNGVAVQNKMETQNL